MDSSPAATEAAPFVLSALVALAGATGCAVPPGRAGFVAVYPSAESKDRRWNDGRGIERYHAQKTSVDDVGFLIRLADHVSAALELDRDRAYLVGISNGAFMTQRIAHDRSSAFAAYGSVIATVAAKHHAQAKAAGPAPILLMGGTEDPLIPYEGGMARFGDTTELGESVGFRDLARFWVEVNGCDPEPVLDRLLPDLSPDDETRVRVVRWDGGEAPVVLYEIEGGGHTWPGGSTLVESLVSRWVGRQCEDIEAAELAWKFFSPHSRRTGD